MDAHYIYEKEKPNVFTNIILLIQFKEEFQLFSKKIGLFFFVYS